MSRPLVTIIVLNWNARALVLQCLRSLEQLTYDPYSVIVVDNGSQDGSADSS